MKMKKGIFFCYFFIISLIFLCNKNPLSPTNLTHPSEGRIELKSANGYYKDNIFYDSTGDSINIIVKISNVSKVNRAELFIKDPIGVMAQYVCWTKEREADTILWKTLLIFNCSGGRFAELVMNLDDGTTKRYLQTIAIKPKPLKLIQLTVD
ncbi:MAG: hypothetical protein N2053_08995, partial [Chitinispirillaceae bacterium]|nr:hypothetical protein [Chitinispirillaceae bacterium]